MNIGSLNRQLRIEKRGPVLDDQGNPTYDASGDPVVGWAEHATVWADFLPMTGKEYFGGGREVSEATGSFRIRYRTDITADMRGVMDSEVYAFVAVLPDRAKRKHTDIAVSFGARET